MKIPGVGSVFASRLEKLGIFNEKDLLYYIPFRYDDFSLISKIAQVQAGETVTVKGKILEIKNIFTANGFVLQKASIEDDTGKLDVTWFNQRFLTTVIHKNDLISLSGKINEKRQLESPQYEIFTSIHTGRLVPIYPETAGISSKWLRSKIFYLLKVLRFNDYLPAGEFMELNLALQKVHFPDNLEQANEARKRLAFDELLLAQVEATARKEEWQTKKCKKFEICNLQFEIPFELTNSQKKVIEEIFIDLQKNTPMNRLLQGDVGSGKTIVAAHAMKQANLNGFQAALMAPTEILANQHFETLKLLNLNVGLATSSNKTKLDADIIVGTHALLNDKINFKKLGLVIIDEQHRFGVEQRAILTSKGVNPHVLTMTATPIPRTVALTMYGDLDLSVIDEMPKNRLPVKTWVVPNHKRQAAYDWIKKQKTQVFIICPFIEESETLTTVKAATTEFEVIKKEFKDFNVGLIHGRLKNKGKILEDFKNKKIDILVATPVVEVGIDVPSATIMVIEGAERFGLAQLHQLRGRVGRGDQQSYCLLFSERESPRLKFMEKHNNGMALAEIDLKFRGPGQRFGTTQHGRWDFKIADFSDLELVEKAKTASHNPLLRKAVLESKTKVAFN